MTHIISNMNPVRLVACLTSLSLLLTALPLATIHAASTGISVSESSLETEVDAQVNFVASTIFDTETTTGTYVSVDDNGGSGSFFGGTLGGDCSASIDPDNQFSINQNKGICYANSTAGDYTITVQLLDAQDGVAVGDPATVNVTVIVVEEVVEEVYGCLDETALNFDETATAQGDVVCEFVVEDAEEEEEEDATEEEDSETEEESVLPNCADYYSEGVVIEQTQILLSHDEGGAFIGPDSVFIPAGEYEINALSFEQHTLHPWDTQENETWFVNLYDANGDLVFTSETTLDVPTGIDYQESELDRAAVLPDIASIEWVHAAFPDPTYQSIYPSCIQFLPVEPEEQEEEIPMPVCSEVFTTGTVVEQTQILLSHDEGGAFIGPTAFSLPAGTYNLNALSFEHHSIHPWDMQPNETWYVNLYASGTLMFTSIPTVDLPDLQDTIQSTLDQNVALPEIDAIEWVHAAYPDPSYQSIYPSCLQFVLVEENAPSGGGGGTNNDDPVFGCTDELATNFDSEATELGETECTFDEDEDTSSTSSGSRSGGSATQTNRTIGSASPAPLVAGTSVSAPGPQVLGEQVSVIPEGAPNTGAGGTSPVLPGTPDRVVVSLCRRLDF